MDINGNILILIKCNYENCNVSYKNRSSLKYHKVTHTSEYQILQKKEELRIDAFLKENNILFKREHYIDFYCMNDTKTKKGAYIDFVIIENNRIIFLEIDEDQHRFGDYSISCDMKRMTTIVESLALDGNTMPTTFIRYNPNSYRINNKTVKKPKEDRQKILLDTINEICLSTERKPLNIIYMYYDVYISENDDIKLIIHDSEDYNNTIKECCDEPIVF